MAVWFGHTQTLTSISKSVSTVASGILGLEDNLATFMKKVRTSISGLYNTTHTKSLGVHVQVIYYDKFFQRVRANLPKEVASTAERLLARCYEYRDEIRDELECGADACLEAQRSLVFTVFVCVGVDAVVAAGRASRTSRTLVRTI